jgi:hypothetical protein
MALKLSPHEEWGQHTVLYCSACHRETFEAWYREQEQFRTGKWTGTECLVCTQPLERTEWFDEPDQGGTCNLECHMVWQIYKKVRRGQDVYFAANSVSNKYDDYPFNEEEIIRKAQLRIKKDQGFFWPCDEENWKFEMAPSWIQEKGHPSEIRYYQQEFPDLNQAWLNGEEVIGPTIFDLEAWKYSPENVIGNLELAPTQIYFKDWKKNEDEPKIEELLVDVEPLPKDEIKGHAFINFHQAIEEIPEEVTKQLQEPLQPNWEQPIRILLERDLIIAPRIARKWESEFILPPSKKHRILEANARDLIAYF